MGVAAIEALAGDYSNIMIGIQNNGMTYTSLEQSVKNHKGVCTELLRIAKLLV